MKDRCYIQPRMVNGYLSGSVGGGGLRDDERGGDGGGGADGGIRADAPGIGGGACPNLPASIDPSIILLIRMW